MIRYQKGPCPTELTEFEVTPGRDWDGFPAKGAVRAALVRDQRGLCAYCQRRVETGGTMKIEHWVARSAPDGSAYELVWTNLLGVCVGVTAQERHCDTSRGDLPLERQPLFLHPVEGRGEDPRRHLRYSGSGEAYCHPPNNRVENDLRTLNQNADMLRRGRSAVLDGLEMRLKKRGFTLAALRQELRILDHGTTAPEYAEVARTYLRHKLRRQGEHA